MPAGAQIAARSVHEPVDVSRLVVLVLLTQVVYWLAHVYAEMVGRRVETGRRPGWPAVQHLLLHVAASAGIGAGLVLLEVLVP
ncbi:hypothetical protein SAMN04515665_12292 [Blastococcus sp. DSM 46786]|nr:hypothetical protein SAMN04515665_12292 [Blastococcus sp. DSM 46786]